jgi:hypothetical protein
MSGSMDPLFQLVPNVEVGMLQVATWALYGIALVVFIGLMVEAVRMLRRHRSRQQDPCAGGCQYAMDVGMWPEHSCMTGQCEYAAMRRMPLRDALFDDPAEQQRCSDFINDR